MNERVRLVRTGLPAGAISSTHTLELTEGWSLASTPPGACQNPGDTYDGLDWHSAVVPGTVASAIGPDDLDRHVDYDASDWWYRCTVPSLASGVAASERVKLRFDGLATLAAVWFNGTSILEASNMFCTYEVDVTDLVQDENALVIVFRSLREALAQRRPRPRWKTKLVENQQLRWFRTTLLGRIPGWTPRVQPVGPWRSVWLEALSVVEVTSLDLKTDVADGKGVVLFEGTLESLTPGLEVDSGLLRVGEDGFEIEIDPVEGGWAIKGLAKIEDPVLWWPRTHGEPALHRCEVELSTSAGTVSMDLGRIGFRELRIDRSDGGIRFVVNGVPIFCRGACWTSNDIVSLVGPQDQMRRTLKLAADGHANMVRIGGTMVYETDDFYRACDELGLMVWQDFMFANMDYPVDDKAFAASIEREATQQLRRLSRHPSVVAFCGGSEVEQQAAMFGAPREAWTNDFFSKSLPDLVEAQAPGRPYWSSTPTGGALPFHVGEELAHYFGVGAYKRPLDDVRLAGVKFSPECLGFSNVPEADNLRKLTPNGPVAPHHPAWKAGVPRDSGAGWDFEDIRDYYLEHLYSVDAVELRSNNLERYLALSRSVTGDVMERVFDEWRATEVGCGGALTWFLNDLRTGAGWGIIDSEGRPKAAYYHLRRAWAPRCVRLLDRGLDGLSVMVVNDGGESLAAALEVTAIARGSVSIAGGTTTLRVNPHSSVERSVDKIFGQFLDSTYCYRFGPPQHEAIVVRLTDIENPDRVLSEDVYRPIRSRMTNGSALATEVRTSADGGLLVTLSAPTILYGVCINVRDHRPLDNHLCLTPGQVYTIPLTRVSDSQRRFRGHVVALNLDEPMRLTAPEEIGPDYRSTRALNTRV